MELKKIKILAVAGACLTAVQLLAQAETTVVSTDAYTWRGDTVFQDGFYATAVSPDEIVSTYSASPGYFMPVEKTWTRKNDLSDYPRLETTQRLLQAVYNMGLDEMVNNVEPDTTLRTGKEWAGVWTRDVSYSIILSMAALQPEASKISLMRKVNSEGQIIQDTGSGGAWPVSTDRMIWAVAAYELYKVTGDKEWLQYLYNVVKTSLEKDSTTVMSDDGLVRGETSFIDWREQSYPKWMQTADIYNSESFNTAVVHYMAMEVLSKAAFELGNKSESEKWQNRAEALKEAINKYFWIEDKGHYGMYRYGRDFLVLNPRSETLGQSLAILYGVSDPEQALTVTENSPVTKYGAPIFFPQIADMPSYHNNALWPFVAAYWTLANAKAGNEQGVLQGYGSIVRPAALFATNKENLTLDNGDITTELNSSNMLWSLAGNIALVQKLLFGINFEENGIVFSPFVPKNLEDARTLENFKYRDAVLNITVKGYGDKIVEFTVNGKKEKKPYLPAKAKGVQNIEIVLDGWKNGVSEKVNMVPNSKAPLTPIVRWTFTPDKPFSRLEWSPIEYIASYDVIRDGQVIDNVTTTTYEAEAPGEYMIVGVSTDGTRSFASEPLSNRNFTVVEMPGETIEMKSAEISYQPTKPVAGMSGGFVEVDKSTQPIDLTFDAPEDGEYVIVVRYANGNGPVNTENKAAIRTLGIDGNRIGTVVMPQRGVANWNDWGLSNHIRTKLTQGVHTITIYMRPEDSNMNLDTNHALIDQILIYRI